MEEEIDDHLDDHLDKDRVGTKKKGVFTTANWKKIDAQRLMSVGIYLEDSAHQYGPKNYFPLVVSPGEIKVFAEADSAQEILHKTALYQYEGLKRTLERIVLISTAGELADFREGKSRTVNVIAVSGTDDECPDGYCGTLKEILYLDPTAGDIDTYYVDVKPWDKDKALEDKQGLLNDYVKELNYGSGAKITTVETDKKISTKTESFATEKITHKLRLNDGSIQDVPVVVFTHRPTYSYEVQYE